MKFYEIQERCWRCGAEGEMAHHHLIPGNPGRKLSDKYGLVVPLCPKCHEFLHSSKPSGIKAMKRAIRYGQLRCMAEQHWTEEQFREVFRKSYLEEDTNA